MKKYALVLLFWVFLAVPSAVTTPAALAVTPSVNCGGCDGGGGMPACTSATYKWHFYISGSGWFTCLRTTYGTYQWVYGYWT